MTGPWPTYRDVFERALGQDGTVEDGRESLEAPSSKLPSRNPARSEMYRYAT